MKHFPVYSAVLAALMVSTAHAQGAPSPANSIVPACVTLVGHDGFDASPFGNFEVIVRDLANNPWVNEPVTFDVSNAPDLFLSSQQFDTAAIVDCTLKRVTKISDAAGRVRFTVVGWSNGADNAVSLIGIGKIFTLHLGLIGSPTVSAFDLDGASGVGANDLSAWLTDFGSGMPFGRCDYDCSGGIGANDLSVWLSAFGSGAMSQSGACP